MLAPRASSAFVCIRCELKLARPRLTVISNRTTRATFSSSSRHREDQDVSGDRSPFEFPKPRPRSELAERPLGRLRKRKGKAPIRETTARLGGGLKSLGDDAQILVLREEGDAPPEEILAPHIDTRAPVDIISSLMQEGASMGQDDVNSLLESLRPKTHAPAHEPQYISQASYLKLSDVLIGGFTHPQLARYYMSQKESGRKPKPGTSAETKELGKAKKPIDRTDWHPGTTHITKRLSSMDGALGMKKKSKPLLVNQILRFAWNVIQLEEIEAPGELEITLNSWQLYLLNSSNPTSLDRIGRERRAKIEIYSWDHKDNRDAQLDKAHVLRITADKSTAEYTADDVQEILMNTERVQFSLEPWLPFMAEDATHKDSTARRLSTEVLATVGELSGTYIRIISPHAFLIRGLDKASIDQAKRGLLQMVSFEGPTRDIDSRKLKAAERESYLLPTPFKSFLSYRHRSMELGRWSLPVKELTSEDSPALPDAAKSEATEKANEALTRRITKDLKTSQKTFSRLGYRLSPVMRIVKPLQDYTVHNQISAEFGQVLVPLNTKNKTSNALDAPFCHVFPGLSNLLMEEDFSSAANFAKPRLGYEFVPNPTQMEPLQDNERYPGLTITIKYQQGSRPQLDSVAFKVRESLHDIPLPERAVDVRFRVSQGLVYANNSIMTNDTSIRNFIDAVVANIESGERLTAPSKLKVSVPRAAIPGCTSPKGDQPLEYLFTSIRYQQSISMMYENEVVSYSNTRAGKLGEKGGTLSVRYNARKDGNSLENFVRTTFKIADLLTEASGNKKAMNKTVRPRDEMSARKVRRLEMAKLEKDPEGSSRNNGYERLPSDMTEFGNEEDEIARTPSDQSGGEVSEHSNYIQEGDIDDPHIASFLAEEQWVEPDITEDASKTAVSGEPVVSNMDSPGEPIEENIAEVDNSTEEVENKSALVEDVAPHTEEKKASHTSS